MTVSDLPGCMADGETVQQAIAEAHDAFGAWAMAARQDRGDLPRPRAYRGRLAAAATWCLAIRASVSELASSSRDALRTIVYPEPPFGRRRCGCSPTSCRMWEHPPGLDAADLPRHAA